MARWEVPDWFDVRSGITGALVMACVVAAINASHGAGLAATAAGKQFVYTFFFAGLIMRFCTRLASWPGPSTRVVGVAIVVPSIITIVLIYLVHSLRGTPEPLLSTGAVALIAVPSFTVWARRTRAATEFLNSSINVPDPEDGDAD